MAIEPGQLIDSKYRVVRRIGEGGMGTVYEGENERIGRRVAIKVLHAQVAAMPEFVERFEREARAAARIGSPHVCDVLDLGDLPGGDRYIVMEYLDGVSFEDRIAERGKLTPGQLAPIAFELLEGLGMMHGARVIHRDLKPANVFLAKTSGGRGEVVKILDFGVAKLLPLGGEVGTMTQTGTMMGTPLYMSPEQARGARDVDGRTDIYAASVMFYRALTGALPYNADTLNELLFKIVLEDPLPLREIAPEVDEAFADIVHKGLARDIEQRFESARAYQEAIAAWGKQQGRASLSFAVTLPDQPQSRLVDGTRSESSIAARPVASAMTPSAGGTPIAWSESSPGQGGAESRAAATIMTPVSEMAIGPGGATSSPVVEAAREASSSMAPLSDATMASSAAAPGSSQPGPPAIVNAATGPTPVAKVESGAGPTVTRSRRGLIGGLAGAGALAVIAFMALGRGAAPAAGANATQDPAAESIGAPASAAKAAMVPTPAPPEATPAPAATADVVTSDAATDERGAPAAAATPTATARSNSPPATATARTREIAPKPVAAAAGVAPAPTTQPKPAQAKPAPAPTTRKFRTNLD